MLSHMHGNKEINNLRPVVLYFSFRIIKYGLVTIVPVNT